MYNVLKKINDCLAKFFTGLGVVFLALIVISCFVQVFTRYVLNNSQIWTEETARYCFIWAVLLGTTIVTDHWSHASLDFVTSNVPEKVQKVLMYLTYLLVMFCGFMMVYQGFKLVGKSVGKFSTACHYPMPWVYLSVPVSGIGIMYHSFFRLITEILGKEQKKGDIE